MVVDQFLGAFVTEAKIDFCLIGNSGCTMGSRLTPTHTFLVVTKTQIRHNLTEIVRNSLENGMYFDMIKFNF